VSNVLSEIERQKIKILIILFFCIKQNDNRIFL
jgi:hypothetical protein